MPKESRIEEVNEYRDRIIEFVTVKAKDVAPNTRNWRKHGGDQRRTLDALLRRIGKGDILKAYRNGAGELVFLDGHLRADLNPNESWHVAILDLTDEEAELYLAAHDSITGMAEIDSDKIKDLLSRVKDMDAGLKSMFGKMVAAMDEEESYQDDDGSDFEDHDNGEYEIKNQGKGVVTCPGCGEKFIP